MGDAYRTSKSIVFSLDMRQVSGIVAGTMMVLVITFALGVGFGHRLATAATAPVRPADPARIEGKAAAAANAEQVFTYQKELTQKDKEPIPPPPRMAPAPPAVKEAPAKVVPAVATNPVAPVPAVAPAPQDAPKPRVVATLPAPAPAATPEAVPAPPKDTQDRWTVQFGAPAKEADARKLVQQLSALGYSPFITEAEVAGKGHVYRVRMGRFPSREDADKFRQKAQKEHHLAGIVMGVPAP